MVTPPNPAPQQTAGHDSFSGDSKLLGAPPLLSFLFGHGGLGWLTIEDFSM